MPAEEVPRTRTSMVRGWEEEPPEVTWWGLNPTRETSEAAREADKLGLATVAGSDPESDSRLRQETDS